MKMPTAVARPRVQWKPGEQISYAYGDGTFAPEDRLPMVAGSTTTTTTTNNNNHTNNDFSSGAARSLPRSGGKGHVTEAGGKSSASFFSGGGGGQDEGGEGRKRFPNLGPTRQDIETYFRRRRRSAKDRVNAQTRPIVTRSADRVVPANPSPARRVHNITTSTPSADLANTLNATIPSTSPPKIISKDVSTGGNRNGRLRLIDKDHQDPRRSAGSSKDTLPSFDRGYSSQTVTSSLPSFERIQTSHSVDTSSPSLERLQNSPVETSNSLPLPTFDHLTGYRFASPNQKGFHTVQKSGSKKTDFFPMKVLTEASGHLRAAELPYQKGQQQRQKILKPSKYGFHRRSQSPTFKLLVAANEKLQGVVPDSDSDSHLTDKCYMCGHAGRASPTGIRLPAVTGLWDNGDEGEEAKSGGDNDVSYLYPHEFLSSLPHSTYRLQQNCLTSKIKRTRTVGTSMPHSKLYLLPGTCGKKGSPPGADQAIDAITVEADLTNGWGAWEVDSLMSTDSGVEPAKMTVPQGLAPSGDSHTELHLFLPRLADTASEESSSKPSPDQHWPRLAENRTSSSKLRNDKGASQVALPLNPRLPRSQNAQPWAQERSSRPQVKRFSSPVRAVKRDRTPNKRRTSAPLVEAYESYEPFIKGEHLKEKLEDFPTLISLDHD